MRCWCPRPCDDHRRRITATGRQRGVAGTQGAYRGRWRSMTEPRGRSACRRTGCSGNANRVTGCASISVPAGFGIANTCVADAHLEPRGRSACRRTGCSGNANRVTGCASISVPAGFGLDRIGRDERRVRRRGNAASNTPTTAGCPAADSGRTDSITPATLTSTGLAAMSEGSAVAATPPRTHPPPPAARPPTRATSAQQPGVAANTTGPTHGALTARRGGGGADAAEPRRRRRLHRRHQCPTAWRCRQHHRPHPWRPHCPPRGWRR